MDIGQRMRQAGERLKPAERKAAEVVAAEPQAVAFGTVATLARIAGVSGATVVRMATKLGFDGFADLQMQVQAELSERLGPAATRVGESASAGSATLPELVRNEVANVEVTLLGLDAETFDAAVEALRDNGRAVYIVAGDCARGVAITLYDQLTALRSGVHLVDGNLMHMGRAVAGVAANDVVLLIDFSRYDRAVAEIGSAAHQAGATVIALTDSALGEIARVAAHLVLVSAVGVGPFESQAATMAVVGMLTAAVARRGTAEAQTRLGNTESMWGRLRAVID